MTKLKLTKESILQANEKFKPKSYSALYRALGGTTNVATSTIQTMNGLVNGLEKLIKANRGGGATLQKSGKTRGHKRWKRHPKNPYRLGSYATAFDIVASFKDGLPRAKLEALHAQAMGRTKSEVQKSRFDCAVVLSPKGEGPTSERHKSTREGYGVRKTNGHVMVILPND